MGHALSATGKLPEILDVLEHEDCGQIHQVWQQFTIRDFIKIEDEEKIEASLLRIKKDRPNNFSKFVSCIADVFEDSYNYSTSNPKTIFYFPPSCQFLCLLLSISGDEPKNSAWFQSPPNILNAKNPSPIFSIIQTFSKLLNFGRPANEIIQDLYSVNDLIEYTRVLLFILHSPSFHQKTYCMLDPTPYLLAFDSFPAKVYLPTLFKLIFLIFTQKNINQKLIFFIRTQLSLALPCLYSCKSWKDVLISLDPTLIHKALSVILLISKPTLNCAEQLVALLYVVLTNHKKYIDFLDNHNFTNNYIIGILLIYQYKTEIKSPITFLHSIMLLTLCRLTTTIPSLMRLNEPLDFSPSFNFVLSFNFSSSFNFVSFKKPQEGTVADMLIDIIYYSVLENFGSIGPILPLISGIISNISSTTVNLSKQSSKQLFSLLRKCFEYVNSNNDIEQKELAIYIPTIERLLAAIFSFIRYQTAVSWPLFEQLVVNKDMIVSISKCQIDPWKDYAALLLPIIEAAEQPINDFHAIMSKNANIINSHNNLTDANANNNLNNSILRLSRSDLFNINSNDNLNSPGRIHYNRSGIVANIVDDSLNSQIRPRKYSCEIINVHNAVSPVLARYNEMPNVPKIEFRMTPEIEIIWFDWFRVMLWQLFPDDSQFYDLHFVSFSLLENQKIKKNNNFIFDIKNNTEEEDNNDDDKI